MENNKIQGGEPKELKELALHYMQTLVDVARESFLILDPELRVISANPTFYQNFQVLPDKTESRLLYELGDGQWDIPELKKLLEEILPMKKTVKNYEVNHNFPAIGEKTMLLNARQIDKMPLIVLAIEDFTERKELEKKLAETAEELAVKVEERTAELKERINELEAANRSMVNRELKMVELKKEIEHLKKLVKNGNGN